MKIEIELYGEAAEKYMSDKLQETMRRLIVGNDWACERETATELKSALKHSHIVSEKHSDDKTQRDDAMVSVVEGLLRSNRNRKYRS